jgi:hypothetical protein
MISPELVQRIGAVDTIVCHTDFDGLCSAAKWLRKGQEPYPNADADARAIDTRTALAGPIGQRFDRALRARPRDVALFGLIVRHLTSGLEDSSLWGTIDDAAAELAPIEDRTRALAVGYRIVDLQPTAGVVGLPKDTRSLAFLNVSGQRERYDKTLLLLMGQDRANLAALLDRDTLTLASRYGSGVNFLEILGLSGGMPTLVSIPATRVREALGRLGVAEGDLTALA